ncbi:hypothetical protein [Listeria aquatica]|uniref:Uncharacterized protein n=1 Tax=Listeria aquatica FSL S10-1188 TaxID=1265818 RepID=W7B1X8_9LIST|nr:hypothetical protein [Listeria aquatica]EUJ16711.1 hypothetical protein MAQA_15146 [Listeria aquatica FSL S10-1188]
MIYANYKGKVYKVSEISGQQVRLVSEDKNDTTNGFKLKEYPDYYLNKDILPNLYVKEVSLSNLSELFEIKAFVRYQCENFELISNSDKQYLLIGTSDSKLAKKNGFYKN